ncbi:MAG: DUF2846 domain-containing protein [Prolixibacteraceae bacterium]|nr:DUF2846 domain-containing protein [Prolixibacteraceae bacterium]MBN2775564.1 DUF2846 domain-containing protein [Prolixibacteraceae bacterium]
MKKVLYPLMFVALMALMIACSSTKKVAAPDPLKQLEAPADKALLYIVRPAFVGTAINFNVSIDGEFIGKTKGKNFIYTMLEPGKHTILSQAENKEELEMVFEAGKIYYIEQVPKMGIIKARNKLETLNAAEGIKKLAQCRLTKGFVAK